MSQTPSHRPRHALADQAAAGDEHRDTVPTVPARDGADGPDAAAQPPAPREDAATGPDAEPAGVPVGDAVPRPAPPADDVVAPPADPSGDDAATRALPAIPRQRAGSVPYVGPAHPPAAVAARLPEPVAPAPEWTWAPDRPGGTHATPSAPGAGAPTSRADRLRPLLPAVLGAAAAVTLVLGVVAGVSGAPEPAADPLPAPAATP